MRCIQFVPYEGNIMHNSISTGGVGLFWRNYINFLINQGNLFPGSSIVKLLTVSHNIAFYKLNFKQQSEYQEKSIISISFKGRHHIGDTFPPAAMAVYTSDKPNTENGLEPSLKWSGTMFKMVRNQDVLK